MPSPEVCNYDWSALAERALEGGRIAPDEGLRLLRAPDAEVLDILAAAYRVRRKWHGNRVQLNFLINARCGHCGEDCGYCSQSRVSKAQITTYNLLEEQEIFEGARRAVERRAKTYCVVTSGRKPSMADLDMFVRSVRRIKAEFDLQICVSPGFLTVEAAKELAAAGVNRVNHNLNTSERFYPSICTTHAYQDRLDTLAAVRAAGMEICSGGIVGMGETPEDVVELALRLGDLQVEASPVNFLEPISGTPLENAGKLDPRYCLKVLALFRLANPRAELRIAAGREMHLRSLQPLGLYAANSIFVGDYLTTKGQPAEDDYRMLEDLGFEVVVD